MVRRTSRTRDGFSIWLVAAWKRRLNCSRFSSASWSTNWSSDCVVSSSNFILCVLKQRFTEAGDHLGLDWQFLGGALERRLRDRARNTVQLEQDPAGLHSGDPIFRGA